MRRVFKRRVEKNFKFILIIILILAVGYLIYLLPGWVSLALLGAVLIKVGWFLYDR